MKILLLGAAGQLGREIAQHPDFSQHHQITALSHSQLDITDRDAVLHAYQHYQPDFVINAAAYTQVDQAEKEPVLAHAVNAIGAGNLAEACETFQIPLLHFSTDYIFNGEKIGGYVEQDAACPINVYGASKWEGEELVRQHCTRHLILRVSWVFGRYGKNFVHTILRLAQTRKTLNIVSDQIGCPTATYDIACVSFLLMQHSTKKMQHSLHSEHPIENDPSTSKTKGIWGTYHFCGNPETSWYDFAQAIVDAAKPYPLALETLSPIPSTAYPTPAQRPKNSVLDCSKIEKTFGISPASWTAHLPLLIEGYFREKLHA
jgi:dTDP-4-dehydrorhamnose reductase